MTLKIGIDVGGTFTDFALLKGTEVILHKNLSTPEDRSIGVMEGLARLAAIEGLSLQDFLGKCDAVVHGTTIADNTLIEMNGALTGKPIQQFPEPDAVGGQAGHTVGLTEHDAGRVGEVRSQQGGATIGRGSHSGRHELRRHRFVRVERPHAGANA